MTRPAPAPMTPLVRRGGLAALALVALLTLGTVGALALRADPGRGLGPAEWAALRFTLWQALLSAGLSCLLAVPAARALARRRFPGRAAMVALLGAPFLLPAIVAVFGIVAVWGRAGIVSRGLEAAGLPGLNVYGLVGVVLAHVFFNVALVARLLLQGWLAIPGETFRLAAQLGFGPRDVFRRIELPMLRSVLPGAFVLVFLLCMTSFAVALTLGGGPRATTVELAIYQALRFDFDLGRAAWLALIQFALCGTVAVAALRLSADSGFEAGVAGAVERWDAARRGMRALDAAALAIGLGLALAALVDARRAQGHGLLAEAAGLMTLAASPFVIGTGLFILLFPVADPFLLALPVTATVNAAMALPFVLRSLLPALAETRTADGRLAESLGMRGWTRFRLVAWARLRRPMGFAAGLAAALSMGDLGVIALFAPPEVATLPLLMQRLMAAYRMEAAAGVGLLLVALTYALFWVFDRGGRLDAGA